ncbi:hypothetical protein JYU19_02720 [bacterium AH-315-J21]|nr:hypothetical protein [bacterium AH-315-J21]
MRYFLSGATNANITVTTSLTCAIIQRSFPEGVYAPVGEEPLMGWFSVVNQVGMLWMT